MILAGDIGGTKTHLAFFKENEKEKWVIAKKYKSSEYENLSHIVKEFLQTHSDYQVKRACFGIAGPVQNGICRATNLPWIVNAQDIAKENSISAVFLINDLEANAYGLSCLKSDEFFTLNEGKENQGNRALISAGTGLGEAGLFWDGKKHLPFAGEGGHCSFAPQNEMKIQLLRYLANSLGHVSFERVLSGPGLYNLYRFIIDEAIEKEKANVRAAFETTDRSAVITEMGLKKGCPACEKALELFIEIYGEEAANLALKMLAVGGVYLGGGIAPKILPKLKDGTFMKTFAAKGRFQTLLEGIPVKVILNENTALLGAASYAKEHG